MLRAGEVINNIDLKSRLNRQSSLGIECLDRHLQYTPWAAQKQSVTNNAGQVESGVEKNSTLCVM